MGPFVRACVVLTACAYTAVRVAASGVPLPLRVLAVGVLGVLALRALVRLARAVGRWQRRMLVVTDRRALLVQGGVSRREFVKIAAAGTAAVASAQSWAAETRKGDMIYRDLGRTGEKVSAIGLGGFESGQKRGRGEHLSKTSRRSPTGSWADR